MLTTKPERLGLAITCRGTRWLIVFVSLTAACTSPSTELPAAPPVALQGLLPKSADALAAAVAEQRQAPDDAESNGRLAMLLHAHDRPQAASAYYARALALDDNEFRWAYLHGLCLEELGEAQSAIDALRRAMTLDPDYVAATLKLAGLLLADGDIDNSGQLARRAVEAHPERADTQFGWGRWLLKTGQAADAVMPLREALRINGDFGEGHYLLASALRESGSLEQALTQQALFEQHRQKKLSVADPERLALEALNTTDRPHLFKADELMQAGYFDEAITSFLLAAEINPSRITTHINLVMLYGRNGDVANANKHFEAGMTIDPEDPKLHFQYGNVLLARREFADAARHFERSLAADPGFANAQAQLGEAREALGDIAAAAEAYRKTLDLDPDHRQANYRYGRQLALREGAYGQALDHLARALEPEDGTTVVVLHAMAGIYAVQNQFQDAVTALERARIISQRHASPPGLVARIDAELARFRPMLKGRGR